MVGVHCFGAARDQEGAMDAKRVALAVAEGQWEVIGGVSQGGVLVRAGRYRSSRQEEERLGYGSIIEGIELVGDRLKYELVQGTGPSKGWVSLEASGRPLVQRLSKTSEDPAPAPEADPTHVSWNPWDKSAVNPWDTGGANLATEERPSSQAANDPSNVQPQPAARAAPSQPGVFFMTPSAETEADRAVRASAVEPQDAPNFVAQLDGMNVFSAGPVEHREKVEVPSLEEILAGLEADEAEEEELDNALRAREDFFKLSEGTSSALSVVAGQQQQGEPVIRLDGPKFSFRDAMAAGRSAYFKNQGEYRHQFQSELEEPAPPEEPAPREDGRPLPRWHTFGARRSVEAAGGR